jgi:AraC family ethanolamine operon transcriptional activator
MQAGGLTHVQFPSLVTHDFDELANAFHRWNHRFRQLGRGPFQGRIELLQVGGIQIARVAATRMFHAEGVLPPGSFCCAPVLTTNEGAVWRGKRLKAGQARVLVPGEAMDHVTTADYQTLILLADSRLCRETASGLYGFDPQERLEEYGAIRAHPLRVAAFCSHLSALLDNVAWRTHLLADSQAAYLAEQECVRRFLGLLAEAEHLSPAARPPSCAALVRRAEEYLAAHLSQPPTLAHLCRELGVSERTLHYAFQEVRGMSPKAYIKARRLNAVRQELKTRAEPTVYQVAQRWGFHHPGEFAADYQRLFGELPSTTLTGKSTSVSPSHE